MCHQAIRAYRRAVKQFTYRENDMGFFDDITGLVGDVAKVALAPVEVVATVARSVTKPLAELAQDVVETVREEIQD